MSLNELADQMFSMRYGQSRIHLAGAIITVWLSLFALGVNGAEPSQAAAKLPATLDGPVLTDIPTWSEALRAVLLTAIPDQYEDLQHWGKTNEIFDGFRVQQRGFNIRASERKRTVNHGAWHRYRIELIDPAKTLKLVIDQVRPIAASQFQFQIALTAKLRCRGDFEHWILGVKGFNTTIVSDVDVRIVTQCQLAIRTEFHGHSLLPDVILEPRVDDVKIFLTDLDVKRIGELRGDIAEEIGRSSRHDLENLLQAQEGRVIKKANEAIDKKQRSLHFSTSQLWKSH